METMLSIGNDPLDPNRLTLNNGIQQGDFYVGPLIPPVNATPVQSITEYLAKRDDNSESFVTLKVLQVHPERDSEVSQGKLLLHNEHLVLSLLQDQAGVIHHQGFFKDRDRFILVLDCLVPHNYDREGFYKEYINLQHYVIKKKRLEEKEALELLYHVLLTIQALHKKNIVHRDLKLGNLVLNQRTRSVTLTNFALSKHLVRSSDKLTDQRGSLAYVSPDVLSGRPYDGKASDMWALGVLLYTMLYGQFPFYDNDPQELFKKIKAADYVIPNDGVVRMRETTLLIRQLIEKDFKQRLTAAQTLDIVHNRLSRLSTRQLNERAQVVPDSVVRSKSNDCTVPEQDYSPSPTHSSHTHSINGSANMELNDLNSVHLALSPMLVADIESHSNPMHMLGSPPLTSPTNPPYLPFVYTDIPASQPQLAAGQNPFIGQTHVVNSTSPTHSLNVRQHSNSLGNLPEILSTNMHTSPPHGSPLSSFPPSAFVCHRYPVALSIAGESFLSQTDSRMVSSSEHSHLLMPMGESGATNTRPVDPRLVSSQSMMDNLVTMRPMRHSFSASVNVDSMRTPVHRHSLSAERLSPQRLIPASTHSQTQRRRRNSSGTERVRRHSHQSVLTPVSSSLDPSRRRRRSHDTHVTDDRLDTIEGQRLASARRNSRTMSSPFSVPIRIQLSGPIPTTTVSGDPPN